MGKGAARVGNIFNVILLKLCKYIIIFMHPILLYGQYILDKY